MNKTISTILGILIVVLVAGVAGASVLFFSQGDEKETIFREETEKETFSEEKEIIVEEDAKEEEEEIMDTDEKRKNEENGLEVEKELEVCNTSKCYADVAISVNNYFICEKLLDRDGLHAPGWIPYCYTYIAIEKSDKKICDLIESPERSVSFSGHTEWCYCSVEKGEMCPLAIP
jgi:DNA-directed RNA polymerase